MVSKVSVFAFAKWLGKIIGFITETILSKARRANCVGLIAAPAKTACVGCVSLGTLATPTRWTNKTVLIARTAETSSTMPTFTLIATTKKTRAMDFTRGVQKIVILAKELVISSSEKLKLKRSLSERKSSSKSKLKLKILSPGAS
eukprot:CAMPEP_0168203348 /NCGR_PEP_ID=MMETSP0139_2-20121125/24799_1 /TAXON_ID=44445 /ORGANISM="Pseudo-nitzschia australis, Strain 10249 10 AB" /LENGTH=144 /DNA_ID=CAMNT_0008129179 /DNA_START=530 /DNA_END=964 /DNA_ORIENTATION=-